MSPDLRTVDLCVVGGGPAGLALASALIGSGMSVVLLESGGIGAPRFLGDVRVTAENPYEGADQISRTRAAYLGGTSGLWSYRMSNEDPEAGERGCRYAPLDPIDFEARADVPYGGWPFGRAELDPWYAAAQPVCGLGRFDYSAAGWSTEQARPLDLDPELIETRMFQFAPASVWTKRTVAALEGCPDVEIITSASVTELVTEATTETAADTLDDVQSVSAVRYCRPDRSVREVRARRVVLAAGGIENSRLLLLGEAGERGLLGNSHDQVGRYWMEHPLIRGGMLVTRPGSAFAYRLALYDATWRDGTKVMAKLSITPDHMRAEGLISTSVLFIPRDDVHASPSIQARNDLRSPSGRRAPLLQRVRTAATMASRPRDLLEARKIFPKQTGVDHNGWSAGEDVDRWRVFEILHQSEQTPDPENRITLTDERDSLGRRIPALHWVWSQADRDRVRRSRDIYAEQFARAGIGNMIQTDWDDGRPRMVGGNHHHMGGTRISPDARTGVVDADLRVHGTSNLFVAGSSVFPAGGSVNPTLTIVALSLRLAAHLRATR